MHEGEHDAHLLPVALGEILHPAVEGELEAFGQLVGPAGSPKSAGPRERGHVVADGHATEEPEVPRDVPGAAVDGDTVEVGVESEHPGGPGRRPVQVEEGPYGRGLPGPVRSEESEDLAGIDPQVEVLDGPDRPEDLGQSGGGDGRDGPTVARHRAHGSILPAPAPRPAVLGGRPARGVAPAGPPGRSVESEERGDGQYVIGTLGVRPDVQDEVVALAGQLPSDKGTARALRGHQDLELVADARSAPEAHLEVAPRTAGHRGTDQREFTPPSKSQRAIAGGERAGEGDPRPGPGRTPVGAGAGRWPRAPCLARSLHRVHRSAVGVGQGEEELAVVGSPHARPPRSRPPRARARTPSGVNLALISVRSSSPSLERDVQLRGRRCGPSWSSRRARSRISIHCSVSFQRATCSNASGSKSAPSWSLRTRRTLRLNSAVTPAASS